MLGVLQGDVRLEQGLPDPGVGTVEGIADTGHRGLEAGMVEVTAFVVGQGGEQPGPHPLVVIVHDRAPLG